MNLGCGLTSPGATGNYDTDTRDAPLRGGANTPIVCSRAFAGLILSEKEMVRWSGFEQDSYSVVSMRA